MPVTHRKWERYPYRPHNYIKKGIQPNGWVPLNFFSIMGYCTVDRNSNISNDVIVNSSDIEDSVVKTIYSDGRGLHVIDNHNCDTWIDTTGAIEDNLSYKIEEIEREYENQLQRQKVHISRGDRITGHRIHGRSRKVTIPKRCFRNSQGIKGMPVTT